MHSAQFPTNAFRSRENTILNWYHFNALLNAISQTEKSTHTHMHWRVCVCMVSALKFRLFTTQIDCKDNCNYIGEPNKHWAKWLRNQWNARTANEIRTLHTTIHPVYRLTDQLCKDMVIVFAHRIQSKYLLTKQKMLNAHFVSNKLHHSKWECVKKSWEMWRRRVRERERKGRKQWNVVHKVFNHIYSHIQKHLESFAVGQATACLFRLSRCVQKNYVAFMCGQYSINQFASSLQIWRRFFVRPMNALQTVVYACTLETMIPHEMVASSKHKHT